MTRPVIVTVIILAVVAALVAGLSIGKFIGKFEVTSVSLANITPSPSDTKNVDTDASKPQITKTFQGTTCGVAFEYPDSLSRLDAQSSGSAVLMDMESTKSGTIMLLCQSNIPEPDASIAASARKITIKGDSTVDASTSALYYEEFASNGKPVVNLYFIHPLNNLPILLAGTGKAILIAVNSMRLLP